MIKFLVSTGIYLAANAIGLLIAAILLPGFTINVLSFVLAVLIFSGVQTLTGPLLTKISLKNFPQLMGGIALVVIFIGLWITDIIMPGMQIGGISNWLAATLLVWIGSLVASIVLPMYLVKEAVHEIKN